MPIFEIRDENGEVFNRVEKPAVVFDKVCGTLLKIGSYENMQNYYEFLQRRYWERGCSEFAEDIVLMELPKDQDEIDKVFHITGYIKRLYEKSIEGVNENENP